MSSSFRRASVRPRLVPCLTACALAAALGAAQAQTRPASPVRAATPQLSEVFWRDAQAAAAARAATGAPVSTDATRLRALALDRTGFASQLKSAPAERSDASRMNPLVISLPHPNGGFQRFQLVEVPVMEPELAARHRNIKTYSGRGLDEAGASLRLSVTPLGLHASVRSSGGQWYIDPLHHQEPDGLYASYYTRDLRGGRPGRFAEPLQLEPQLGLHRGRYHAAERIDLRGAGFRAGSALTVAVRNVIADALPRQQLQGMAGEDGSFNIGFTADPYRTPGSYEVTVSDGKSSALIRYEVIADNISPLASTGTQLRSYRLALLTDPSYATYHGGGANVTAAKAVLMNRVNQIYEDETSIRMLLIGNNDLLNLDTAAQMTGTNGPCGGAACYSAGQASSCTGGTLTRTRQVIGLLVGASSFDVGHIALGNNGGGVASLGVVGGNAKAQGCTGLPTPIGDFFAVDYVAHELGHQFAANHTFNGVTNACSGGNRSAANSVEPGSGTSIMAYAGICGIDNTQNNSDPYWAQRSFDEVVTYVSAAEANLNEVQLAALGGFSSNGQQFVLSFNGSNSAPIVRGTNFTTAGVVAAIQGIPGWPAGGTVAVSSLSDTGFTVTFGGLLAATNVATLQLLNCTAPCTGFVGEVAKGGLTTRNGAVSATGNSPPVVSVAGAGFTIPIRTPFALSGSATDADGDTVTYMWEQTDRGGGTGTALANNTKVDGPLFRQFGTRQNVANPLLYAPPGQNATTTDPVRVFPDLLQLLANNTNAENGACPTPAGAPTPAEIDCYSEFLPTAAYLGFAGVNASPAALNFKLTARDGRGGVNSATTRLVLAPGAGPFLVTAPNTAATLDGFSSTTVSWNVANTHVAPVDTANVKITLSLDGGLTYPVTLAASVPNSGSRAVRLPNVASNQARVKVEALGNVFFDVSNANFTIRLTGDVNGSGAVDCADIAVVRAAFGKSTGQPGFDARADVNGDGRVDVRDLSYVSQRLPSGTSCP